MRRTTGSIAAKRIRVGALVALAACAMTRPAGVQAQPEPPRVIVVYTSSADDVQRLREGFMEGLREAGQVDGRTVRVVHRYGDRDQARAAALIRESARERPAVLVVSGLTLVRQAREATSTIPIVVATAGDLVAAGLVASLSRPGGNVTGVSDLGDDLAVKRLELAKAALPGLTHIALLNNPDMPAAPRIEARVGAAAAALGVKVTRLQARDIGSLGAALDALQASRADVLLIGGDGLFNGNAGLIIDRATAQRIAVVHYWPGSAERGALISFQADTRDNFRRAAGYVDRILKGEPPAELPIHQPNRYEIVVNAKAARSIGLSVAPEFLLRADRVIR